jgi:hypothetical protein
MSRERANKLVRDGEFQPAEVARLNPDKVERLAATFEGLTYVPVDDLDSLISDAVRLLQASSASARDAVTFGVAKDTVKQVLVALLRVPAVIEPLTDKPALPDLTKEEVRKRRQAHMDAASIARQLSNPEGKKKGAPGAPTYEKYVELLAGVPDADLTQRALLSARADDASIQLPSGEVLPDITPPPRTLRSARTHQVMLTVLCVDEAASSASVQIVRELGDPEPAMEGLVGATLPMSFNPKKRMVRNWLIALQLIEQAVACNVHLTRALRAADSKHTALALVRMKPTKDQLQEINDETRQLSLLLEAPTDRGVTDARSDSCKPSVASPPQQ